ncbi:MFS transporter [Alcaligenes sp. 13f]|uniref:MFS transporter n=1 Tax=Alcaligenes sp. 13f TaxID=2841924 RepID=UPI001CF61A44|nr:MFS transporter [Alcaligenes sp. 13f]MCB4322005.1 MFS transporter [Alcaligenes sp. 13f]
MAVVEIPMDASVSPTPVSPDPVSAQETRKVVIAASLGTVFEWYEFTLYAALATVLAKNFFAGVDPTTGFIFALLTFAVGFIMRPVGALVFGRVGDRIGRKKTFLITVIIMGVSTTAVGLLPTYQMVGIAAPIMLIVLRMLQGLALGGEYGGAATYVVEHSPAHRRGFNSSWISSTGTIGLLSSFGVIYAVRKLVGEDFDVWGWRIPFVLSLVLLVVSVRIRRTMHESPAFEQLKNKKQLAQSPLRETFLDWTNVKRLLVAFFGICGGMTCVYYTAVLYPNFFLTQTLKVDPQEVTAVVTFATLTCIPLFAFSGWLCDRLGRKPVLLAGFALVLVTLFPIFKGITNLANPQLGSAQAAAPVVITTDLDTCSFMFNPLGSRRFTSACDVAKQALTQQGVSYEVQVGPKGAADIRIGQTVSLESVSTFGLPADEASAKVKEFQTRLKAALVTAGYPDKADPATMNKPLVVLLLAVLLFYMALTLVPSTLMLVEMFPTRIRYTSMSFPYHFASGWVGGLLPTFTFAMAAQNGDSYFGLWYPLGWVAVAFLIALFFLKETRYIDLESDYR